MWYYKSVGGVFVKKDVEIYMCDDDKEFVSYAIQEIRTMVGAERNLNFAIFNNGEEMIEKCRTKCADVLFLDIDMPGMNGFEVAETIQEFYNDVLIIFLTSHDDMVFHSFKYRPFWFVRKNYIKELSIVIPALLKKLDSIYENLNSVKTINIDDEVYKIDVKSVKVVSSYHHYVFWEDETGKETRIRAKIQNLEKQFADLFFVRVQKGIIVNLRFISKINSRRVILKDGSDFNISRDQLEKVRREYIRYLGSI